MRVGGGLARPLASARPLVYALVSTPLCPPLVWAPVFPAVSALAWSPLFPVSVVARSHVYPVRRLASFFLGGGLVRVAIGEG